MVVTIDGPAAAGKSTTARELAAALHFDYLDTGAMYRAVSLAAVQAACDLDDDHELGKLARSISITQEFGRVFLNGEDVTVAIRDTNVTAGASRVAESSEVRDAMVQLQRQAIEGRNVVTEGRDQGTIVFPNAFCKFFLTADPTVRATRRQIELNKRGIHKSVDQVLSEQNERDDRDSRRDVAPLAPAPDAIVIDSTSQSSEQVVALMADHVRQRELTS